MTMVLVVQLAIMSLVLIGVLMTYGSAIDAALAKAILLLFVEVLVITAVALLFSSFSTPLPSAFFTLGVFVVGRSTPEIRAVAGKLGAPGVFMRAVAAVVPDLHLFFASGSLVGGERVTVHEAYVDWSYVGTATIYGLGYAALMLAAAAFLFRRRDFV
jgi:hypothetical protein